MRSSPTVVIVAEADLPVRTLLQHLLRDAGYQVEPCADAAECYYAARAIRPQLALLDVSGRGPDAFWLAVLQLYADPVTRRIPMLLMTTNSPWLDQARPTIQALGLHAIAKPFDTAELLHAVARMQRTPSRRLPTAV